MRGSLAQNRYPLISWQQQEKRLWNPIHRKALKNRPEERVRLRIIDYLVDAGWSKHRITTEEAISGMHDQTMRTDIICYNKQFKPVILVECKAENVPLKEAAAQQTARYNRAINAPYILLTNGVKDFWFEITDSEPKALDHLPEMLSEPEQRSDCKFKWWEKRGFAGKKSATALRRWIIPLLNEVWLSADRYRVKHLEFKNTPTDLGISHYYWIRNEEDRKVATASIATPYGGTRLYSVMNRAGKNEGVFEVNLDLLFDRQRLNTSFYSRPGTVNLDIREHTDLFTRSFQQRTAEEMPATFLNLFDKLSG